MYTWDRVFCSLRAEMKTWFQSWFNLFFSWIHFEGKFPPGKPWKFSCFHSHAYFFSSPVYYFSFHPSRLPYFSLPWKHFDGMKSSRFVCKSCRLSTRKMSAFSLIWRGSFIWLAHSALQVASVELLIHIVCSPFDTGWSDWSTIKWIRTRKWIGWKIRTGNFKMPLVNSSKLWRRKGSKFCGWRQKTPDSELVFVTLLVALAIDHVHFISFSFLFLSNFSKSSSCIVDHSKFPILFIEYIGYFLSNFICFESSSRK